MHAQVGSKVTSPIEFQPARLCQTEWTNELLDNLLNRPAPSGALSSSAALQCLLNCYAKDDAS